MAEEIQYIQLENGYKVWTKRVGRGPVKILTLHGGPGCSSEYIEAAFKTVFSPQEFEIIYYDQLGSYRSDQPSDPYLWTIERFCEEVEQVRKALNLQDFYLYGQSWGGRIAIDYALNYQQHLKGLVLSNVSGCVSSYESYTEQLYTELPQEIQNQKKAYEEKGEFTNPSYQKLIMDHFYSRHLCRLQPWPQGATALFDHYNPLILQTMREHPASFSNWDRWDDLAKIKVPTLVISGRYDIINPTDTLKMAQLIPKAKAKICEKGSHLALYDDAESYFEAILEFLKKSS